MEPPTEEEEALFLDCVVQLINNSRLFINIAGFIFSFFHYRLCCCCSGWENVLSERTHLRPFADVFSLLNGNSPLAVESIKRQVHYHSLSFSLALHFDSVSVYVDIISIEQKKNHHPFRFVVTVWVDAKHHHRNRREKRSWRGKNKTAHV
jgi:hypothetical protein